MSGMVLRIALPDARHCLWCTRASLRQCRSFSPLRARRFVGLLLDSGAALLTLVVATTANRGRRETSIGR